MKTSIPHNKYFTPRLKEDNDPISAKSAPKILSLNLDFLLLNFLITGFCNFWASSSFALAPDYVFLSKDLYTIFANPL